MVPNLLLSTLPLTLGFAPLAVFLGGRARPGPLDATPGFSPWPMGRAELIGKVLLLSVAVYPALFFLAAEYIAFRSAEVRAFYGELQGTMPAAPAVYRLECLRGALWVVAAATMLRSTRGTWWVGTLRVALWFALVQNDVLILPNPLMTEEIRAYHFAETTLSNLVFALCIGWLLGRSHLRSPRGTISPTPSTVNKAYP